MLGFVTALNAIGSQVWACFLVMLGVATIVISHKNGIDIGIGSGIIGAGVNMFTTQASKSTSQTGGDRPATLTQVTEAPGLQTAPAPSTPKETPLP